MRAAPQVFLAYRRDTSSEAAGWIKECLRRRIRAIRVFLDTDDIIPGSHFPSVILNELQSSALVLALVGPGWAE